MDPNETLKRLRELMTSPVVGDVTMYAYRFGQVSSVFEDLDDWLSGGGFLPKAWEPEVSQRFDDRE